MSDGPWKFFVYTAYRLPIQIFISIYMEYIDNLPQHYIICHTKNWWIQKYELYWYKDIQSIDILRHIMKYVMIIFLCTYLFPQVALQMHTGSTVGRGHVKV